MNMGGSSPLAGSYGLYARGMIVTRGVGVE
jgi:hypothetical protein